MAETGFGEAVTPEKERENTPFDELSREELLRRIREAMKIPGVREILERNREKRPEEIEKVL